MTPVQMKARTKRFAVAVIRFCVQLPKTEEGRLIARQLMRAGTSVGANYRAAQRGRSKAEFAAKLGIVIEEADECGYWLELLEELSVGEPEARDHLKAEAEELVRIVVAAVKSARSRG